MAARKKKNPVPVNAPPPGVLVKLASFSMLIAAQARAAMSDETVLDYAEVYRLGRTLPPIEVVHEGGTTGDPESWTRAWVWDGNHRVKAAIAAELRELDAYARPGTEDDAWRLALGANAQHGLRRTNADKRAAVLAAFARWPRLSARKVAELCGVTHPTVLTIKAELEKRRAAIEAGEDPDAPDESVDSDAYYTPADLAQAVAAALGGVDLDPCSHPDAPMWNIAEASYDKHFDGLAQPWMLPDHGAAIKVWLQPPYSDPAPWIARLVEGYKLGEIRRALVMVFASSAGTDWWAQLMQVANSVGPLRERVRHLAGGGQTTSSPREGSILVGVGKGIDWKPLLPFAVPFYSRTVDVDERASAGRMPLEAAMSGIASAAANAAIVEGGE